MDLTTLEANKNILVYGDFVDVPSSTITQRIDIPFTPDYMIVKYISYSPVAVDQGSNYAIYSDIVGDYIGTFDITENSSGDDNLPYICSPNLYFKINKPITGTCTFQIQISPIVKTEYALGGRLVIYLDFVKLKSQKPQKIF